MIPTDVYMHTVSEADLESLAGSGDGLYLAALGIAIGAFISLVSTVETIFISDPYHHAIFVAMTWLSAFVSILLGIKVSLDRKALTQKLNRYRQASKDMVMSPADIVQIEPRK